MKKNLPIPIFPQILLPPLSVVQSGEIILFPVSVNHSYNHFVSFCTVNSIVIYCLGRGEFRCTRSYCNILVPDCTTRYCIINHSFSVFIKETKEDRQKQLNPKLLFPMKAWLRGFLPGHQFHWEEENYCDETNSDDEKVTLIYSFIIFFE